MRQNLVSLELISCLIVTNFILVFLKCFLHNFRSLISFQLIQVDFFLLSFCNCLKFQLINYSYLQVKLSGRSTEIQVTWATEGLLAVSTGDGFVRLWNLDSGDNFVLDLREPLGYKTHEHVLCISYSGAKRE